MLCILRDSSSLTPINVSNCKTTGSASGRPTGGFRESGCRLSHLSELVRDEADRLEKAGCGGNRIVLGGISQGAAVGMWTWLFRGGSALPLAGFIGAGTWLAFADEISQLLQGVVAAPDNCCDEVNAFWRKDWLNRPLHGHPHHMPPSRLMLSALIMDSHYASRLCFLGHGVDDGAVDVSLGRQTGRALESLGL
ncbi:Phospholipase/Carboxylesterase [Geosmithia morbida]|uniref:Phospholipase/Carboxylesterase n=1 Tax=Geosmithia morbida TaxID=1094350 RepID=A0A9P4YPR7_9HYPO|nr:Phospholipase/Carboxylesterase [Geosmithia morbida]KAF4119544.1 Phospholipase/Carboxylesterase [Geosmithia morbida]